MHLLWKRYSRSGGAPPWFYGGVAGAFAALIVWAVVEGNWLVAGLAAVMVFVTIAGARLMRRMNASLAESRRRFEQRTIEEDDHGR